MATAVPIDPAKLLEAARDFANHQSGAGRPRPIWLRRAVSSAYYALYHAIGLQALGHLLPNCAVEDRLLMVRSLEHGQIKAVCQWAAGRADAPERSRGLTTTLRNTRIDDVANTFIDLQDLRHLADYDHLTPFAKESVLGAIRDAEGAIDNLNHASEQERETFFTLLAFKSGIH